MEINRYSTWELDELVASFEPPNRFLQQAFFAQERYFETDTIEFDVLERGRPVAPFVSPYVSGKPMRKEGHVTKFFKPAYIKMSYLCTPRDGFTRLPGEPYGGVLTPQERLDRDVAEKMIEMGQMLEERLEWMAAQALVHGQITVSGEDYPTSVVDFNRDPNNEMTAAVAWSDHANADPMTDIENLAFQIRDSSRGQVLTDLIMDGEAWGDLRKNEEFLKLIDLETRGRSPGTGGFELGPRNNYGVEYLGRLANRFNLWLYDGRYTDAEGVEKQFLDARSVIGVANGGSPSNGLEGMTYYAAIQDLEAGILPIKMFHKSKVHFDPSALEVLGQSAPMLCMKRPNATGTLAV